MFTARIYHHLVTFQAEPGRVKVAHSAMLAIAAGKEKNDRADAQKLADLLRCDCFPECHMAAGEIRDRRRVLRYCNLLVRETVRMKNKVRGLLMTLQPTEAAPKGVFRGFAEGTKSGDAPY